MSPASTNNQPAADCCHSLQINRVITNIGSDLEKGLTAETVAKRSEIYGWNELPVKPGKPAWLWY